MRIRWVRLRFRWEFGEDVAASWVELVGLGWSIVAKLSDVWRGVLVGGTTLGWPVCDSVAITRLEHCGWVWASTADAWESLGVWSMG